MRLPSSLFLCACLACLCLAGCSEEKTAAPAAPRPARVAVVTPHKLALVAQGAGRIQSRYVSQVGFEVGGRLISRDVDIGDIVKKGQKLAELSAVDYQNKVTAAEADLAAAKAALAQAAAQEERFRILLAKGFATHSIYDDALRSLQSAEAAVKATEANLRIAQNQLSYTQLLAPDDGVVTATGADPGQVVTAGQMVVEISRNDEHEAVFAVASEHVAHAKLGMAVKVWLQGRPDDRGHRHHPGDLARGRQHDGHLSGEGVAAFAAARDAPRRGRRRARRKRRPGGHEPAVDRPAAVRRPATGLGDRE